MAFAYAAPVPPQHRDVSYGVVTRQEALVTGNSPASRLVPTGPHGP